MTYEYMQGMGLTAGTSLMSRIAARSDSGSDSGSSSSSSGGKSITTMKLFPGSLNLTATGTSSSKGSTPETPLKVFFTGVQMAIPAGYVPIKSEDKDWFKRWFRQLNSRDYDAHLAKDPNFTYADPDRMARFLDAKYQVELGLDDVWDLSIGAGGKPISGTDLERAQNYFNEAMRFWTRCDSFGGVAWATAPSGTTVMKLPRLYVERYSMTMSFAMSNLGARASCPDHSTMMLIWRVPLVANRTTGTEVLRDYIKEKEAARAASSTSQQQQLAAKQEEISSAQQQADAAQQRASELQGTVGSLEAALAEATLALDAARDQAATTGGVDNTALAALQAQVTELNHQLAAAHSEMAESRRAADLAEQAFEIEGEEQEGSLLGRYKWHLAIGGLAAAGAGLWYYYFKYLPAKGGAAVAAAPTANPDGEEAVYDDRGRLLGTVWPAAVPGRWIARSSKMNRPLYSATSPERAAEWLGDAARRLG